MIIFIVTLIALVIFGIKFDFTNGFTDYMSPQKTGNIKGIFTFIVLISHVRQYLAIDNSMWNKPYLLILNYIGQLMVVMFLFYSGYGVLVSIKKKDGYVNTIPYKRCFKTWYHFAVAVVIYYLIGKLIGKNYSVLRFAKALIGIDAVGNSNWFIFDVIVLYLLTYVAFKLFGTKSLIKSTTVLTALTFIMVLILFWIKKEEPYWYNTVLCYPLGMWYGIFKEKIDSFVLTSKSKRISMLLLSTVLFIVFEILLGKGKMNIGLYIVMTFVFVSFIVSLSMNISVGNKTLSFFGNHVFEIYILQRIPMIILTFFGMNTSPVLFTAAAMAVTVVIAPLFKKALK